MKTDSWVSLSQLVNGIAYTTKGNLNGIQIRSITSDSKQVREGDLFVAIKGTKQDGHHYLEEAIHRSAAAVVVERPYSHPLTKVLQVSDTKKALSYLADVYYHCPSQEITTIGITGTNGKTTVTYLLEELFREEKIGVLGTISYRLGGRVIPAIQTTPSALEVHAFLREMVGSGCRYAAVEVSSHALDQSRVADVDFKVAIFTNLSHDHLDYHQTMEAYGQAKIKLFKNLTSSSWVILNGDDPFSQTIRSQTKARVVVYGFGPSSEIKAESVSFSSEGTELTIVFPQNQKMTLRSRLIGRHNAYNLLASVATGFVVGKKPSEIQPRLERLPWVPGRLELVTLDKANQEYPKVFVDYAHTPDGLKQVLMTLRELTEGRLYVVFGCGGDRDKTKRPIMGRIAAELADEAFVTTDNPRSEEPLAILEQIWEGIRSTRVKKIAKVNIHLDRATAIREAILSAQAKDVVLIAGKGHENYQIFKEVTIPFDDREQAKRCLEQRFSQYVSIN